MRKKTGISIITDHFGMMASASKIAGYDWKEAIKLSSYYGPGFFVLFSPLLKFCDNPIIIYNIVVNICLLVEAVAASVLYYILDRYIYPRHTGINIIVAMISSFFVLQSLVVSSFGNEQCIVLLTLVIALCICKILQENTKKKHLYLLLMYIIVSYSIFVHIRNVVFVVGIIATFAYIADIYESKLDKKLLIFGLALSISSFVLYKFVPKFMVDILFDSWDSSDEKFNLTIDLVKTESKSIFDYICGYFHIFIGNIYESIIQTYGIILYSYYLIIKKVKEYIWRKKNKEKKKEIDYNDILFVFSSIMYTCGLFGLVISRHGFNRMIGYWRYYGSYSLLMIALSLLYGFENKVNNRIKMYLLLLLLVCFKYTMLIGDWITDAYLKLWFVFPGLKSDYLLEQGLVITFIISLVASLVLLSKTDAKAYIYAGYILVFYLGINLGNGGFFAFYANEKCDSGYELITQLSSIGMIDKDSELYYIGSDEVYLYYQFMELSNGVKRELPEEDSDILVFSDDGKNKTLSSRTGWACLMIDENEYVYSKNSNLLKIVEEIISNRLNRAK